MELTVRMFDAIGREVQRFPLLKGVGRLAQLSGRGILTEHLRISLLPAGFYFLEEVNDKGGKATSKLLIE